MSRWWRPILSRDLAQLPGAIRLAGGPSWFSHLERLSRDGAARVVPATEAPADVLARLTAPRAALCGLDLRRPRIMAILNVTPDSFSDGGRFASVAAAAAQARAMIAAGADIIDIGGESTRPGAETVPEDIEIARSAPVIAAIRAFSAIPISIDTRKAAVAQAALDAGASMVNDVSALTFDSGMASVVARAGVPLCLMHAQGTPQTMQADPHYDDVLLDVYDHLSARIRHAAQAGIPRDRIVIDPGIGFGKTIAHNIQILQGIALFHSLGCPILLGASRKGFIGVIGNAPDVADRLPGSLAVALHGVRQGVQILRVHDTQATRQAFDLHEAIGGAVDNGTETVRN
jgi:dihydropteroate synthase